MDYDENDIIEKFGLDLDELEVDFDQLDVEWGTYDSVLDKYLKASAYCDKLAKKAHEQVKFIRSKLILDVTSDPQGCLGKGQKAVASTIEAYYRTNEEYLKAKEEQIDADYVVDLVNGLKSRAYTKKIILQEAAKLSLMGWFSSPMEPRGLQELVDKIQKAKDDEGNKKIREATKPTRRARRKR